VRLTVYDMLGREVAVLVDGHRAIGRHEATVEAGRLSPGTYLVRLQAGDTERTQRLTIVR
jgi:hypothetical protein